MDLPEKLQALFISYDFIFCTIVIICPFILLVNSYLVFITDLSSISLRLVIVFAVISEVVLRIMISLSEFLISS